MPKYRTKVQEVEAIRLQIPLTISGSSDVADRLNNPLDEPATEHRAQSGDWLLTHPDGQQEIVTDADFHALYEQVPTIPRRGRPPKHGSVAVASTKRKRRTRTRRKNGAKAKAAA